ncbi:MAG: hypothetical protein J7K90_02140 [Desulfuromusa sp.]|nr:hypothetical protein [Desulfuromusa sp.]
MKKQMTSIAIASIFAFTALFASAATHLSDQELGIGEYGDHAHYNAPKLNDEELGIGEYGDHAHYNAPKLNDEELGIGEYGDHA